MISRAPPHYYESFKQLMLKLPDIDLGYYYGLFGQFTFHVNAESTVTFTECLNVLEFATLYDLEPKFPALFELFTQQCNGNYECLDQEKLIVCAILGNNYPAICALKSIGSPISQFKYENIISNHRIQMLLYGWSFIPIIEAVKQNNLQIFEAILECTEMTQDCVAECICACVETEASLDMLDRLLDLMTGGTSLHFDHVYRLVCSNKLTDTIIDRLVAYGINFTQCNNFEENVLHHAIRRRVCLDNGQIKSLIRYFPWMLEQKELRERTPLDLLVETVNYNQYSYQRMHHLLSTVADD